MKEIEITFLKDYPSLKEGVFDIVGCSKAHLKKYSSYKKLFSKKIRKKDTLSLPIDLLNNGLINPIYSGQKVGRLLENKKFLVLSKPAKIHSHPLRYGETDNILSYINTYDSSILKVNKENYDRGLLYRLDFETSGCLVYIKDEEDLISLRENFSLLVKEKIYLAVVEGNFQLDGEHTHYLKPSGVGGARIEAYEFETSANCKEAKIKVEAIEYNEKTDTTIVKVMLYEGHRHQIRSQLKALGYAILGDPVYGNREAQRMYLHCYQYRVELDNEEYEFEDNTFKELLTNLFSFNSKF